MARTPMMEQYLAIKARHPGMILLFRVGDFYETFFEDAKIAARELNIVLTARGKEADGDEIPLAGVPYHSVDNYISRLIKRGYKVAICDQIEDPKEAKGNIVERDVTRIVTPGTLTESNYLDETANNYLAAIYHNNGIFGLSYVDISTSDFYACDISGDSAIKELADEIARISPAEVIMCEELALDPDMTAAIFRGRPITAGQFEQGTPQNPGDAEAMLNEHFRVRSLEGFGLSQASFGRSMVAAAAIIAYLRRTQKNDVSYIRRIIPRLGTRFMHLDSQSRTSLDLPSLFSVLNFTKTAMGARTLRNWLDTPLCDIDQISWRQDAISEFSSCFGLRESVMDLMGGVYDMERIMARVSLKTANPRDLNALKRSLDRAAEVRRTAKATEGCPLLAQYCCEMADLSELSDLLGRAIVDDPPVTVREGGIIREGFDERLDEVRKIAHGGKEWLLGLEQREQKRSGIKSLKIKYNRIFGYYIEITKANLDLIPSDYIRKQTLAGAERFYTPELKEMENQILNSDEQQRKLEYEIYQGLLDKILARSEEIFQCAKTLAAIDSLASLSEAAGRYGYCRPAITDGDEIEICDGRHPVVENRMNYSGFISNDTLIGGTHPHVQLLTGPNMAGKSTYIRQVALIALMAQTGSSVPARSARIGVCDRIFTRIGASDNLAAGQSTFMVEMIETANILNNATAKSLIILDEIGRGTSTYDGLAIAYSVLEFILGGGGALKDGTRTLFATHYHELTVLDRTYSKAHNLNVAISESDSGIVFLHRIVAGPATKSYGIHVARIAGLPEMVVARAADILASLEASDEKNNITRLLKAGGRGRGRTDENQLDLFDAPAPAPKLSPEAEKLIAEIRAIDLNGTTPIAALNKLAELSSLAGGL